MTRRHQEENQSGSSWDLRQKLTCSCKEREVGRERVTFDRGRDEGNGIATIQAHISYDIFCHVLKIEASCKLVPRAQNL